jgi:arginine decarboxylase
MLDLSIMMC